MTPDLPVDRSSHGGLPTWQRENATACEVAMMRLLSVQTPLQPLCVSAVLPGRKLRASLALQYVRWAKLSCDQIREGLLMNSLARAEFLHSASCILDDIIDGDTIRRGQPVFHVRAGMPQAILTAQELIAIACSIDPGSLIQMKRLIQDVLVASIRGTLVGEACDSFPFSDTSQFVGHASDELERVYLLKTTPGFAVSHRIVGVVHDLSESETEKLARFGEHLGAYYQYANDYYDWFFLDQALRGGPNDEVLVPLCIPTIVGLDIMPGLGEMIGRKMPRKEFTAHVRSLVAMGVESRVRSAVDAAKERVWESLPLTQRPQELEDLVEMIDTCQFWGYRYRIQSNDE